MRFVLTSIFVILNTGVLITQHSFYDVCRYYNSNAIDDSLKLILDKNENSPKVIDKITFHYFKGCYNKYNIDKVAAIKELNKSLSLCQSPQHDSLMAFILDELALLAKEGSLEHQIKALNYIDKSLNLKEGLLDNNQVAKSYLIKGNIFFRFDSFPSKLDSALSCYQKVNELSDDEYYLQLTSRNIGNILLELKEFPKAEEKFLQAIIWDTKTQNDYNRTLSINNLLRSYTGQNKLIESAKILDTLLEYARNNNYNDLITPILSNHAIYSESINDYESANRWKDSIIEIQHDIFSEKNLEAVEKYEAQTWQVRTVQEKAKKLRNLIWAISLAGFAGLISILYYFLTLRKKALQTELENTKLKSAFDATKAKMEGEQKERQEIASVLHDQVASLLTAADMHLKVAKSSQNENALEKTKEILKDVNYQVRNLSHQLVSPALKKFGLGPALESLVDQLESEAFKLSYFTNIDLKRFDSTMEVFIYNACAELIQNILKHSNGNKAVIELIINNGQLTLNVEDNGASQGVQKKKVGLGLIHISERAQAFGGTFILNQQYDQTVAILSLPYDN